MDQNTALIHALRRDAKLPSISSLIVPELEDAADALERANTDKAALLDALATAKAERNQARKAATELLEGVRVGKDALSDLLRWTEEAWGLIANVSGSDWTQRSQEWQEAAARWRDGYFRSDNNKETVCQPKTVK